MKYLGELEKLNLPKNKYAIFGSGPMAIRGLREIQDLDIIAKADLWNELAKKYPIEDNGKNNLIKIGEMEIFKDWLPWFEESDELIDSAETIEGFPFVRLQYLLKWKKILNREKDQRDIEMIEKYLKEAS